MIKLGDCLQVLRGFEPESIDMCMTSPPYWGLRDYGHDDQYGVEETPEEYIEKMTAVFSEVKRVLKAAGTLWLNCGDTYANSGYKHTDGKEVSGTPGNTVNLPPKCLCMIPERLAWSLIQDGWVLRNKCIWYKPNGMPSSVKDRFTNKWEYIFLFSKSRKYYFDLDAVRDAHKTGAVSKLRDKSQEGYNESYEGGHFSPGERPEGHPLGKNPGDVFTINTQPFPQAHFAVFPEKLCEKPIKAGCPEGGTVLDPFCGAGTTGAVAKKLNRNFIGIDIKQEYVDMASKRIDNTQAQLGLPL